MPLPDAEKRKIARVIWTYSGKKQPEFEAELGFKKERLRSMLAAGAHSPPTTDELLVMADAAGVPREIALNGWAAADPLAHIERLVSDLRADLAQLAGTVAEQAEELRELRDRDPQTGSGEARRR